MTYYTFEIVVEKETEDVGYLAAYLMSDAAEFMTGQIMYLDGGLTAKMAIDWRPPEGAREMEIKK